MKAKKTFRELEKELSKVEKLRLGDYYLEDGEKNWIRAVYYLPGKYTKERMEMHFSSEDGEKIAEINIDCGYEGTEPIFTIKQKIVDLFWELLSKTFPEIEVKKQEIRNGEKYYLIQQGTFQVNWETSFRIIGLLEKAIQVYEDKTQKTFGFGIAELALKMEEIIAGKE